MAAHDLALSRESAGGAAPSFERLAGLGAIAAGAIAFLYAVSFVLLRQDLLTALCLTLSGLLGATALVAVYERLRAVGGPAARWAVLLGVAGALGSAVHGADDLANAVHPPASANLDLPSPVDPRGFLTFGVAGLGLLAIGWLMARGAAFPRGLAYLGQVLGVVLVVVYLARLVVLDPGNPILLGPVLLAGFVLDPLWYVWLGLALLRRG